MKSNETLYISKNLHCFFLPLLFFSLVLSFGVFFLLFFWGLFFFSGWNQYPHQINTKTFVPFFCSFVLLGSFVLLKSFVLLLFLPFVFFCSFGSFVLFHGCWQCQHYIKTGEERGSGALGTRHFYFFFTYNRSSVLHL